MLGVAEANRSWGLFKAFFGCSGRPHGGPVCASKQHLGGWADRRLQVRRGALIYAFTQRDPSRLFTPTKPPTKCAGRYPHRAPNDTFPQYKLLKYGRITPGTLPPGQKVGRFESARAYHSNPSDSPDLALALAPLPLKTPPTVPRPYQNPTSCVRAVSELLC